MSSAIDITVAENRLRLEALLVEALALADESQGPVAAYTDMALACLRDGEPQGYRKAD